MGKLDDFLDDPTPERYVEALDELAAGAEYTPYAGDVVRLPELLKNGKDREILETVERLAPTVLLSPVAHHVASVAAKRVGDEERAEFEHTFALVCYKCILGSGDGSKEKPLPVCIIDDEYFILEALEMDASGARGLQRHGDRWLDVFHDIEMCFDVTRAYRTVNKHVQ